MVIPLLKLVKEINAVVIHVHQFRIKPKKSNGRKIPLHRIGNAHVF